MARYNQFSGRTAANWKARYRERKEIAEAQIKALQAKGVSIEFQGTSHIGEGGVPGWAQNVVTAQYEGRLIGRKAIRKLCLEHGIELNNYSYPVEKLDQ
jgi:hypothetical protein